MLTTASSSHVSGALRLDANAQLPPPIVKTIPSPPPMPEVNDETLAVGSWQLAVGSRQYSELCA
ncbi:MAG: hypothetical protein ACKVK6_02890, partial [bacterium]